MFLKYRHGTNTSICGYITIATVRILSTVLGGIPRTVFEEGIFEQYELEAVSEALVRNPQMMLDEVEVAMA